MRAFRCAVAQSYLGFLRAGTAVVDSTIAPGLKSSRSKNSGRPMGGRMFEPDTALLLYCMAQGWVGRCMHEQRLNHVNPVFVRHLRAHLDDFHGRQRLPSAGLLGMAIAIAACSKVTLFGFGNATDALQTVNECLVPSHVHLKRGPASKYMPTHQRSHSFCLHRMQVRTNVAIIGSAPGHRQNILGANRVIMIGERSGA